MINELQSKYIENYAKRMALWEVFQDYPRHMTYDSFLEDGESFESEDDFIPSEKYDGWGISTLQDSAQELKIRYKYRLISFLEGLPK